MPALIAGCEAQAGRDPGPRPARPARARRQGPPGARAPCRVVSGNGWPSPGRWPTSPRCVLADEPTGALDSEGGEEVLELFRRLHAGGQTILLVTHDQPVADAAQRIVRMKDGRVVSAAVPAEPPLADTGSR